MPAGRPKKKPDLGVERVITELSEIQCTMKEISAVTGLSVSTLERNYDELIKKGQECGRKSLRRKMFELAYAGNGNVGMLIWLSKQHLEMTDKVDNKIEAPQEMVFKIKWADDGAGSDYRNASSDATTKKNK